MEYKVISWNVNGIRAVEKKGFHEFIKKENPHILMIQETKIQIDQLTESLLNINGYKSCFHSAVKKGYSGVGIYSRIPFKTYHEGFGEKKFDDEGRVQWIEWEDIIIFNIYFPNGQKDDERLKYKLDFYDYALEFFEKLRKSGKTIIIGGDFNTAHKEIDLSNPKDNSERSGFLPVEREWLDLLCKKGYFDSFRKFHLGEKDKYSWWTYRFGARKRNIGWRIDYFFVSNEGENFVKDGFIMSDVEGSDHCPVGITLEFDQKFGKI